MLISVDFDGTLTRSEVQKFVTEAVSNGHEVIIVTQRYNESLSNKMFGEKSTGWNKEVIDIGKRIGVSKIYFTNLVDKYIYLNLLLPDIHLDDDNKQITDINQNLKHTLGINILRKDWDKEAKHILNNLNY